MVPNKITKRPNSGYTAYFFNEDFAAYAYSKEAVLVNESTTIIFKVNAPPSAMMPDNMPKELYLKTRDTQLTSHRNLLSEHWKHAAHTTYEAIVPLLPEAVITISDEAPSTADGTQGGPRRNQATVIPDAGPTYSEY